MKKIIAAIVLVGIISLLLYQFIDINMNVQEEKEEKFTYSITTIPENMKNIQNLTVREQDLVCATSKGLVSIDSNGEASSSLSTGVEVKEGGIQYEFTISDNIYWSNGEKITPQEIVNFFKELISTEEENNIKDLLNIYGVEEFKSGKVTFEEKVAIKANNNKITIRLNNANEDFLKELSKPQYRVRKDINKWENINSNYNSIVYSGDYYIDKIEGSEVFLKRNVKSNSELIDEIVIVEDEVEEVAMAYYEMGTRDVVVNPPKTELTKLKEENKVLTIPSDRGLYLAFNKNSNKSNEISLNGRKEIYGLITRALYEYVNASPNFLELAEGSYFRDEKENLDKLQGRKVMTNTSGEQWEKTQVIRVIARESAQNNELCTFLSEWFSKNTDLALVYEMIDKNISQGELQEKFYDMEILECGREANKSLYDNVLNYLDKENREKIENASLDSKRQLFGNMEDDLFSTYTFLPLMFFNENIAINDKSKNIKLDYNGNIDFSTIKK